MPVSAEAHSWGSGFRRRWLSFVRDLPPSQPSRDLFMKNVALSVLFIQQGECRARWICRGKEHRLDGQAGWVRAHLPDGLEHVTVGAVGAQGMRYAAVIIPPADVMHLADVEGLARVSEDGMRVWPNDPVLRRCLGILTSPPARNECLHSAAVMEEGRDEAARGLLLRLAELMGAGRPDWLDDTSTFTPGVLGDLVAAIDAHLKLPPTALEAARQCGLSPSHFARKFRQSTGTSFQRFVNRRRVQASFRLLEAGSASLAHLADDLGFASQSHFTRVFSELTGMTPAKFRRDRGRTLG